MSVCAVQMLLSRTVIEIQRLLGEKSQIFHTPSYLALSFEVIPFKFMKKLHSS